MNKILSKTVNKATLISIVMAAVLVLSIVLTAIFGVSYAANLRDANTLTVTVNQSFYNKSLDKVKDVCNAEFAKRGLTVEYSEESLIGADGEIFDFPGVEYTPRLKAELANREIKPIVKYGAAFEKREDGRHLMVWTVRPDGDYWMDSWGFGGEDYDSVSLYTYLDDEGRYLAPFRLYSIGCRFYAGDLLAGHLELLEKFPMFARCTEGTA